MKTFISTIFVLTFHFLQAQNIDALVTDPSCAGNDNGAIDITFTGGVSPYIYQWSDGSASEDLSFLVGGSYFLTITDSQGEIFTGVWDLIDPVPINIDGITNEPECNENNGASTGSIDLIAVGGTEGFIYLWEGPGVDGSNEQYLTDLGEGVYSVTVTDANGCSEFASFFLAEPDEIIIDADVQNLDCVMGQSQFGSIQINTVGGFGPYTYEWSGTVSNPNMAAQSDLIAGGYSVSVTDANGCSAQREFTLTGAEPINVTANTSDVSCNNGTTVLGTIELTITGGIEPYSFSWTGEGVDPMVSNQNELNVGTYSVIVSDSEGCQMNELSIEIENVAIDVPSLCLITNDNSDGYNNIYWDDPANLVGVHQFNIYREGSSIGQFDLIGEVGVGDQNNFLDTEANSAQQAYRYYVTSANLCGYESGPSEIHKTIHLTINLGTLNNINLIWDEYEGIDYDQIKIFRGDSPSSLVEYTVLPGNLFSYTDDDALEGDAYYQIVIATDVECSDDNTFTQLQSNVVTFTVNNVLDFDWLTEIYPNPFTDKVTIQLEASATAEIIDYQGNTRLKYELGPGMNVILTNDLPSGMYIVRIISNGEAAIWKGFKGF